MARLVVVGGAPATGKTTLAIALSKALDTTDGYVPDLDRIVTFARSAALAPR